MKNRNMPENSSAYDSLPRELVLEIFRYLPSNDLINLRLLGQRPKMVADEVFSEPSAAIHVLSSNLEISKLYLFLNCYRRANPYKKWHNNTAAIGSLRDLLLYLLALSNTPIEDKLINLLKLSPAVQQEDAVIADPTLFLSLFNMLAWPGSPDCALRITALVRYFRTTTYFAALQQRSPASLSDDEMLCLILATDDVHSLSLPRLQQMNFEMSLSDAESSAKITYQCLLDFKTAQLNALSSEPGLQPPYINLSGINLQGETLNNINLSGANLENANLAKTILNGVNFQYANLSNANLDSIEVMDKSENAAKTNMSYADLRGATLKSDKLHNLKLTGATFISDISPAAITSLLDKVSINLKTIKAIVNNVIRLIKNEFNHPSEVDNLKASLDALPLESYPIEQDKLKLEMDHLEDKTKRLAPR